MEFSIAVWFVAGCSDISSINEGEGVSLDSFVDIWPPLGLSITAASATGVPPVTPDDSSTVNVLVFSSFEIVLPSLEFSIAVWFVTGCSDALTI